MEPPRRQLTLVKEGPRHGWRDQLRLWATGFGISALALGGLAVGGLLGHELLGLIGAVAGGTGAFGVGYGLQEYRARLVEKRARDRLVAAPRLVPEDPLTAFTGVAQRAEREVWSPLSEEPCLAYDLLLCESDGGPVVLRLAGAADFLVVNDWGTPTLVKGPLWLGLSPPRRRLDAGRALLDRLGLSRLVFDGHLEEVVIEAGDRVRVFAERRRELVPGGYREAAMQVARAGPPLFVEKERF